jgi:HEAT repeat protein
VVGYNRGEPFPRAERGCYGTVARRQAARALGEMGLAAKAAVGSLTRALHDPDDDVREAAAEALRKIDGGEGKGN